MVTSLTGRRVLVTGASGIVGRDLVPALLAAGADVVSVFRQRPAWFDALPAGRHGELRLDLLDQSIPARTLAGITDCVHLAATLYSADDGRYYRDNTLITQNLFTALAHSAPALGRAVLVSSIAARGPGTSGNYPEPQRGARSVSSYGHSKLLCEMIAGTLLPGQAGLTILRPSIVLSAADRRLTAFLRAARRLGPLMAGHLPRRCSVVAVEDVSAAIVAALAAPNQPLGVFDISHPEVLETRRLLRVPPGRLLPPEPVPSSLANALARFSALAARMAGTAPMMTPDKLREARYAEWCSDSSPFSEATGWKARVSPGRFLSAYAGSPDAKG